MWSQHEAWGRGGEANASLELANDRRARALRMAESAPVFFPSLPASGVKEARVANHKLVKGTHSLPSFHVWVGVVCPELQTSHDSAIVTGVDDQVIQTDQHPVDYPVTSGSTGRPATKEKNLPDTTLNLSARLAAE